MPADPGRPPGRAMVALWMVVVALWFAAMWLLLTGVAAWSALSMPPRRVRRAVAARRSRPRGAHAAGRS